MSMPNDTSNASLTAALSRSLESVVNMQALLDSSSDGIVTVDKNSRISYANDTAARLLHSKNVASLLGQRFTDVITLQNLNFILGSDEKVRVLNAVRANGTEFHLEFRTVAIRHEGVSAGFYFKFGDVSARIQQASEKTKELFAFKEFFQRIPIPLAILRGPEHRFQYVNDAYRNDLLGGREVIGKTRIEALPESARMNLTKHLDEVFRTGKSYFSEPISIGLERADGSVKDFVLQYGYQALTNDKGDVEGVLVHAIDLTSVKKREKYFEDAMSEAETANRFKSSFLANMSHEIRTPLNAILGFVELLTGEPLSPVQQRYVGVIDRNGRALAKLVNEILDLSKVESGLSEPQLVEFDSSTLVSEVVSLFENVAATKNLTLSVGQQKPHLIISDPVRIRQILINLVANALKFTSEGSVEISVTVQPTEPVPTVSFEITDTGIGMTRTQREKLFHDFSQADETIASMYGGSGLGLSISRKLARSIGGDIHIIASEPGVGSTFKLEFPARIRPGNLK